MDRASGAPKPYSYIILSAEGAQHISLRRSPRNNATNSMRAESPLNWQVLRQALESRPHKSAYTAEALEEIPKNQPWDGFVNSGLFSAGPPDLNACTLPQQYARPARFLPGFLRAGRAAPEESMNPV